MKHTHIRLTRSGGDEGVAVLIPIAGTIFEIGPSLETLATTCTGRVYVVEENMSDIEEALPVAFVDYAANEQWDGGNGGMMVEVTRAQSAAVRSLVCAAMRTTDSEQLPFLSKLADLFEGKLGEDKPMLRAAADSKPTEHKIGFTQVESALGLVINAPEVFKRADFVEWLNHPRTNVATWHKKGGKVTEFSDIFVLVDNGYEGSDSDMPEDIWRAICDAAYKDYGDGVSTLRPGIKSQIVVRLTNLDL